MIEFIRRWLGFFLTVWVLAVMFGMLTGLMDVFGLGRVSYSTWLGLLIVAALLAALVVFLQVRRERNTLWKRIDRRKEVTDKLHWLLVLRFDGVYLRNQEMLPMTRSDLAQWLWLAKCWEDATNIRAAGIADFEREWLTTLDRVERWPTMVGFPVAQASKVWNLGGTIRRMDLLVDHYRPAIWSAGELAPWLKKVS